MQKQLVITLQKGLLRVHVDRRKAVSAETVGDYVTESERYGAAVNETRKVF